MWPNLYGCQAVRKKTFLYLKRLKMHMQHSVGTLRERDVYLSKVLTVHANVLFKRFARYIISSQLVIVLNFLNCKPSLNKYPMPSPSASSKMF